MVLPAPGGPVIMVSGAGGLSAMMAAIRRRGTAQSGRPGAVILDTRTGSPSPAEGPSSRVAVRGRDLASIANTLFLGGRSRRPGACPRDTRQRRDRICARSGSSAAYTSRTPGDLSSPRPDLTRVTHPVDSPAWSGAPHAPE